MKRLYILFILILSLPLYLFSMDNDNLIQAFEYSLKTDLLDAWYPKIVDEENGGFHTTFNRKWKLVAPYTKTLVSQARGVWVASKAAKRYPDEKKFQAAATHGYNFLKEYGWDEMYGGFFHTIKPEREDNDQEIKKAYGNSFGLYALAAYYDLTKDEEALELAKKTFLWIDKNCHDEKYKGYYNTILRDGTCAKDSSAFDEKIKNLDNKFLKYEKFKDYNSTLHLLESFTELYKVWPDSLVKARLEEIIFIVKDKMVQDKGYLWMNFQPDWTHISHKDMPRKDIIKFSWFDHVTFGHDMEGAFLLLEAEKVIYGDYTADTYKVAKEMMDHSIKYGFDKDYAGIFHGGYYFDDTMEIIDEKKIWWVQAEGLNALLLMACIDDDSTHYESVFNKLWDYTYRYLIDHKYGGWYQQGIDTNKWRNRRKNKAYEWKSCYHNYRAISQCLDMLKHGKAFTELED